MASSLKRNPSRRRRAALSFLSNISLDGTPRVLGPTLPTGNTSQQTSTVQSCTDESNTDGQPGSSGRSNRNDGDNTQLQPTSDTSAIKLKKSKDLDSHSLSSDSDCFISPSKLSSEEQSKRKKPYETLPDCKTDLLRKRAANNASLDVERYPESSTESIGPISGRKSSPVPAPIPEDCKSIKIFKPTKGYKFRKNERLAFIGNASIPFAICSVIPYIKSTRAEAKREAHRKRTTSLNRPLSSIGDGLDPFESLGIERRPDGQETSYGYLLVPTKIPKEFRERRLNTVDDPLEPNSASVKKKRPPVFARTKIITWQPDIKWCYSYDQNSQRPNTITSTPPDLKDDSVFKNSSYHPNWLDDPELIAGKHRTLLTFSSHVTTIIDYVKPSDLKREINDKFKEKFPHIQLTLSKLRSLKREMRKIAKMENIDVIIVAQSYVYFEKLILRGLINKQNRKLCAASCLILAAKLNDVKGDALKALLEKTENTFRLNHKEMVMSEFAVLVALEFGLLIPFSEVNPHYHRLLYES